MSAREGPAIAEPVSCATISRRNLVSGASLAIGRSASIPNKVPYRLRFPLTAVHPPRGERNGLRADRLVVVGEAGNAEEHEGLVHAPQLAAFFRMGEHPLADALH